VNPLYHSSRKGIRDAGHDKLKVIVAAGSSGGHIFPALAFIEALKERDPEAKVLLILKKNSIIKESDCAAFCVKYITIPSLRARPGLKLFKDIFELLKATFNAAFILLDFKPDVAVGFGSLTSVPVLMCAWLMRIPTLLHEQNVLPGRANRLLAQFCDRIAVSFRETEQHLRQFKNKVVFTGNPLRKKLIRVGEEEALGFFGLANDKFTILVMGGSQGSLKINSEFLDFIRRLEDRSGLQVIHLSGLSAFEPLKKGYEDTGVAFKLYSFLEPVHYAYSAADLILSRAGALSVTEIMFFKIPAIIVPYPYARRHQWSNAKVLEAQGASFIIDEVNLSADTLKQVILPLMHNRQALLELRSRYKEPATPPAAELLVNEVIGAGGVT